MQDDHFVLCIVSVPKPIGLSFTGTNISGSRTASLYGISQLLLWLVHAYLDILKKSAHGTYSKFIKLIQNRGDPESLKRGTSMENHTGHCRWEMKKNGLK